MESINCYIPEHMHCQEAKKFSKHQSPARFLIARSGRVVHAGYSRVYDGFPNPHLPTLPTLLIPDLPALSGRLWETYVSEVPTLSEPGLSAGRRGTPNRTLSIVGIFHYNH